VFENWGVWGSGVSNSIFDACPGTFGEAIAQRIAVLESRPTPSAPSSRTNASLLTFSEKPLLFSHFLVFHALAKVVFSYQDGKKPVET
jgi:hypothetical protein